jgi:aromatic-L-amino-acid/L-tryptophan decarboxylase
MFNKEEFIRNSAAITEWIAGYLEGVENYSVRSRNKYGELKNLLPDDPPEAGLEISAIFEDFKKIILPGITHWQSPNYFAYFPANNSEPSILAEYITAAMGVQGMKWITSPAATELEDQMLEWLRKMIGLPADFTGVIQDTASVSTLCAMLAARERSTGNRSNESGLADEKLRVYCSAEAHSSIEKAVRIAGIGSENLVKIPVDKECRMNTTELEKSIKNDLAAGYKPACLVGALGTTGTCAIDPIEDMGKIAARYAIWYHIDAAFAGTALVLPEFRNTIHGLGMADSFVFNPHKWMFTNFDCSAFFVKDKDQLQQTFRLVPSYLQTNTNQQANDYSNWGIQLGRRFRSLKLWFVIRNYGLEGIRSRIRMHLELSGYFENWIRQHDKLEMTAPRSLAVTCFRYNPGNKDNAGLNMLNSLLLEKINDTGKMYISHTFVGDKYSLRFVCAQTNTEKKHVEKAMQVINECLDQLETE